MKAITFIGVRKYELCKYQYKGKECETHLFPIAVSTELTSELETAKSQINIKSKPFAELVNTVGQRYSKFSLFNFSNERDRLEKELALAKWHFDREFQSPCLHHLLLLLLLVPYLFYLTTFRTNYLQQLIL